MFASFFYRATHRDGAGRGTGSFVPLLAADGAFLGYRRTGDATQRVVVHFHGKDGEALDAMWLAGVIPASTMLVLAEYPGYGAAAGRPSHQAILAAAERVVATVRSRWPSPLTVVGESLGSAVACHVASRCGADRLALISSFASVSDVLVRHAPVTGLRRPLDAVIGAWFAPRLAMTSIRAPVHVIHGANDRLVPVDSARALLGGYAGASRAFTEIPDADHVTIVAAIRSSPLARDFRSFIGAV